MSRPDAAHRPRPDAFGSVRVLVHPIVILFVLLPFQWLSVAKAGGFEVRWPYAAALLALVLLPLAPRTLQGALQTVRTASPALLPYICYIFLILGVLYTSDARSMPIRQIFFAISTLGVAAWLTTATDLRRVVRWAGVGFLVAFFVGTEVIARGIGLSWVEALSRFVGSGDLDFVVYSFFRGIFNAGTNDPDALITASQKNILASSVVLALILMRAGGVAGRADVPGRILTVLVLLVLLMVNSRSVLLVAILALAFAGVLTALRRRHRTMAGLVMRALAAFLAVGAVAIVLSSQNSVVDLLGDRFAFTDHSTDARVDQYRFALEQIESAILTGVGYAEVGRHPVHNLFLGAFMHAGIVAFLLVTMAYAVVLIAWLRFVVRIVAVPDSWRLPVRAEWVAVLPILPLFRVWVAGDAGHPGFGEWLSLSLFLGFVVANSLQARRPRRQAVEPRRASLQAV